MNIFGIGGWEILIVIVIILLVLGPDDLQKTGRTVGRWINKVTRSEGWMAITMISREIRGLPSRLAREAQLEDLQSQIEPDKQIGKSIKALKDDLNSTVGKIGSEVQAPPQTTTEQPDDSDSQIEQEE